MTRTRLRLTYATGVILQSIARGYCYGFDIMDASGLPDGTVYPALRRLEDHGFLTSEWEEEITAAREKRPPRRYYGLTETGEAMLAEARGKFRALQWADAAPRPLER